MRALNRALQWLGLAAVSGLLAGCSLWSPFPKATTLVDRLAVFPTRNLPTDGRVAIHWNEHQIPFIAATSDDDAAFALGLVHAHLRLGQMSLVRMIAYGRLSEMVGPIAVDVDRSLRILSFPRAAAAIQQDMDDRSRRWLQRFVDGVNHYQDEVPELPHEFRVLGLEREPWTIADVLAIGRLAGTDVNWMVWASLLPYRDRSDWPELWARLVEAGSASVPSFGDDADMAAMQELLAGFSKSGSNSLVVGPSRTATGGALIANDPHLGIMVPNVWMIVGVKSPSYHAVGLMGPAVPVFAIGRNPDIAWGGTNMRAASSDLYDLSNVPDPMITERQESIGVRWWLDEEVTVRETRFGPVVSDTPFLSDLDLPPTALMWTGHQPSDEIGAMLAVTRASEFSEFRAAFERFAVPGQNMLYADRSGNIGQVMAVQLPERSGSPGDIFVDPLKAQTDWETIRSASNLPYSLNPESGYLASANNRPTTAGMAVGFFFSSDDRVGRMAELVEVEAPVSLEAIMAFQRDVRVESSAALRDTFIAELDASGLASAAEGTAATAIQQMRDWDGHYRSESTGAPVFERFRFGFVRNLYAPASGDEDEPTLANLSRVTLLLEDDIRNAEPEVLRRALEAGLETAASGAENPVTWAEIHRLRLAHPLAFAPVIGGRYEFGEYGVGGSSDTLMKTAHESSPDRHRVRFGANARHVSDLADPDANYFVLLGGQDGWLNSSTLLDQWPLWREGNYVRMPLSMDLVREEFPHQIILDN